MLYTFLITIVFIAEVIITVTILRALWKMDKAVILYNEIITEAMPKIKDITSLGTKISEQLILFAQDFEYKCKKSEEDTVLKILNKTALAILLWKFNIKAIKKFRKSKIGKTIVKGFNFIQSMV